MRKSRLRKHSPRRTLIYKADRTLQDYYRALGLKCWVCGRPEEVMHHIIEKSHSLRLRWEEKNLMPLCRSCHARHHLAGDPEIVATFIKKVGMRKFDELKKESRIITKKSPKEIQEVIESFDKK
jgi:hypothetical protein